MFGSILTEKDIKSKAVTQKKIAIDFGVKTYAFFPMIQSS